jgi:AraC-like DNA-binding protein
MEQTTALISELKRALRESRVTYKDIASHLGLSEASIKRMFARSQFSLVRMEQILGLVQMQFSDLVERLNSSRTYVSQLTPEQEAALVSDPDIIVITFLVLNRWSFDDILNTYDFSQRELQKHLIRLDRLKIIELLPFNRYRLLTARNFTWRKNGPVQQYYATRIQPEFFDSTFEGRGEELRFVGGRLSPDGFVQMQRAIERLAGQFDELAERDSRLPIGESYGCSAVFALRPIEFSMFTKHRITPARKLAPVTQT